VRRLLLIADLEGITGVDSLPSLVFCGAGYEAAARRMTEEVAVVAEALLARGVEEVRISDAHRAGAGGSNLDAALLPAACSVHLAEDMYGGALLDGVDAVCAVGMHASGESEGFGAHTVALHTSWRLDGRPLNETHLAMFLAAERGIPFWFSSGDQVLEAELPGVPFVRTKHSSGRGATRSRPVEDVVAELRAITRRPPPPVLPVPRGRLVLRFQRRAEAEASGGVLVSPTHVELGYRPSFTAQYEEALELLEASEDAFAQRLRGRFGTPAFAEAAAALLLEPWD
jgi:D-amino peptidase